MVLRGKTDLRSDPRGRRLPPDIRLTQAVILLSAAQEKVADYVDGVDVTPDEPTPVQNFPVRKPVGISAVAEGDRSATYVVLDDGSCWYMNDGGWKEYPPIPGTLAARD